MYRIIFGISGASGMSLAATLLKILKRMAHVETHVIVSKAASRVCVADGKITAGQLEAYASRAYSESDFGAGPASGSWQCNGMIICPCSMSTLAAIATGVGNNLIHRAADVSLKERRPLILVPRETPLSLVHLRNMTMATEAGAIIMPFMPAFYTGANSLQEMESQFLGRMLDLLHINHDLCIRWGE